jgi:rifampicin phosphotransferase
MRPDTLRLTAEDLPPPRHTRAPAAAPDAPLGVPLAEARDPRLVGGKAANLSRLLAFGMPVPDGFVITEHARRLFLDDGGLQPLVDGLCGRLGERSPAAQRAAAETIAAIVRAEPLPARVIEAMRDARPLAGPGTLIVRSSAAGEDSASASYAGQLDSVPDVAGEPALALAVKRVWASRWSARALAYEAASGVALEGMGVIVQRQVNAAVSGVLFTEAPDDATRMLLEYCGGMGDALVSGAVNPGRVRIAGDGAWMREAGPDVPAPEDALLLDDARMQTLARLARDIERRFGAPQDIEWTIDRDGRIWIVQTRPITSAAAPRRTPPHPVAPGRTPILWSNANVNENFPQPISPLLYSIAGAGYYHYFRNLGRGFGIPDRRLAVMEPSLRRIIGVHGARMYYNLTSIHGVLREAPFGGLLTASFNAFVGAEDTAPAPVAATWATRARSRLSQLRELTVIAAKTTWQYLFLTRRVERFEARADAFAERTHPDRLATRPAPDLLDDFRAFLDIRCHRWNDAALADAGSMVCYGLLQRLLARACPGDDQQALHNTLLKALPALVSGMPPLRLWDLSRAIRADAALQELFDTSPPAAVLDTLAREPRFAAFHAALQQYLDDWGFRCSAELMLTVPGFQEDPEPVVHLLKAYAALDGPSPAEQLRRQAAERVEATARVRRALRWRPLFGWLPLPTQEMAVSVVLRWTQTSIQLRERARLKQALLYSRLRRVALAIGDRLVVQGRLAARDDVFFLTADEIDALLSGHAMFPDHTCALVDLRRRAHAAVTAVTPPDALHLGFGEYFTAGDAAGEARLPDAHATGVGACGGTITGRAAVLDAVTESHRIRPGDVLVTRQTDPGWGPVFPLISGLVIERGGMLSHGAIIAREFGIPSVVGVKDATRRIPDGARITVDGDRGRVLIVGGSAC